MPLDDVDAAAVERVSSEDSIARTGGSSAMVGGGEATAAIAVAEQAQMDREKRKAIAGRLSESMATLVGKCPTCFGLNGGCIDAHGGDSCAWKLGVRRLRGVYGWIEWKRGIVYRPGDGQLYCVACGCPVGAYQPNIHGGGYRIGERGFMKCEGADFMAMAFWLIFSIKEYREEFEKDFGILIPGRSDGWRDYLMEMEGPGGFYVGVRVWLWFYERRAKVPLVGRAGVPKSAVEKW